MTNHLLASMVSALAPMDTLLIKATLVAAAGLAAARLSASARAAVRHAVLTATLAVVAVLPLLTAWGPRIDLPVLAPRTQAEPAAAVPGRTDTASTEARSATASGASSRVATVPRWAAPSPRRLAAIIWLAGLLVCAVRLALGIAYVRRLRRDALPWPAAQRLAASLIQNGAEVDVARHEAVASPITFGVVGPLVLLPTGAVSWSDAELRRALVHELEHVRRGDWWLQLAARAVCAAYWFHPLIWALARRMSLEAERACDDVVVVAEEQVGYAEQLLSLAERLSTGRLHTVLGMAERSDLGVRIRSILDARQARGRLNAAGVAAVAVAATVAAAAVAPLHAVARQEPQIVIQPTPTVATTTTRRTDVVKRVVPHRPTAADRALLEAAEEGDLDTMESLVRGGARVNTAISGDGSPLIAAARGGRVEAARWLLDQGADPNLGVEGDGNPLIAAAQSGSIPVAALLLERGADIDRVVPGDENALITACGAGRLELVRFLVEHHANVNARVWAQTYRGTGEWRSPLSMARRGGHTDLVAYLIAAGAVE